jgi:hypothetical protein
MDDEKTKLANHATMLRERAATIKNELQRRLLLQLAEQYEREAKREDTGA